MTKETGLSTHDAQERSDLIETLDAHRDFLRYTVRDLSDEQARTRTTVSELCLAGLIKHVAAVERNWAEFIVRGPSSSDGPSEDEIASHQTTFQPTEDETLQSLLDRYSIVANETDELVQSIPSLDDSQPLPSAPWFEPGSRWTARRTVLHILAETAQRHHPRVARRRKDHGLKTSQADARIE
jgi:uncharacterized damage-inducible protein DinB